MLLRRIGGAGPGHPVPCPRPRPLRGEVTASQHTVREQWAELPGQVTPGSAHNPKGTQRPLCQSS